MVITMVIMVVVMVDLVVILMMKALIMLMIVMIIIDLPAVGKPIKVEPQQYLRPDNYITI